MPQTESQAVRAALAVVLVAVILYVARPRRDGPPPAPPRARAAPPVGRNGPGSRGSGRDWHLDPDSHTTTADGRLVHVGEEPVRAAFEQMFGKDPDAWRAGAAAPGPQPQPKWDHANELFPFAAYSAMCDSDRYAAPNAARTQGPHAYITPSEGSPSRAFYDEVRERCSVESALARLYSTADVDPLITGQLYATADNMRDVYAQRTSHGDVHGLTEFSSAGGPGDVGVDVGPYGLAEYGGAIIGYDDGIPSNWTFPSTPVRWYAPQQRDHYGPEGPTVYAEGLYSLTEPDHDVLMN